MTLTTKRQKSKSFLLKSPVNTAFSQESTAPPTIRYKTELAAKADDIGTKTLPQFADFLSKRIRYGIHRADFIEEYHIALLARHPRQYATTLPAIYAADDFRSGDLTLLPEITQMRIAFDFDGPDNPDWHTQLVDALHDARRFAKNELQARGLTYQQDFDAYFTGSKGFRIMARGLTPPGAPKALCDAVRLFCDDRIESYPTLDIGIYNPSPNGGFIRGPGSKHPKTGLWSIFLSSEELLNLPLQVAVQQIVQRAQIRSRRQFKSCFSLDPFDFLGLREEPSEALQGFFGELYQEALELAWIERFQPRSPSLKQINMEALIEQEGLEVRSFIQEDQAALLKSCPACGKTSKAWITRSGKLRCWRSSCEASHAHGGLSLRQWSQCARPEELIKLKAPEGSEPLFCTPSEIEVQLADQRDHFFGDHISGDHISGDRKPGEKDLVAKLQRISPGCKKSTYALDGAIEATLGGKSGAVTLPNHGLVNEKLIDLQRFCQDKGVEIQSMRWRGRDAIDEEGPMCSQPQRVESATLDNLPIQKHACRRCPMFRDCRYQRQYPQLADLKAAQKELGVGFILVGTHHALWGLSQNEKLFAPDYVVVDEDPVNACLDDQAFPNPLLSKPYAEPPGLEVDLDAVLAPARKLLRQALHKARSLHQKAYERELRKAKRKGAKWLPRAERRVSQQGLLELLMELNPEAPSLFAKTYEAIQEAQKELLQRSEDELPQWRTMLSPAFQILPLLEALVALMPADLELFTRDALPHKGFCVELSFGIEKPKLKEPKEPQQEPHPSKKQILTGGTYIVQEARTLPYQGPVLGLDATGEELPWQAMLGRRVETLRLDAPLHKDSLIDWFELGTYQSALLKYGEQWMDEYLIKHVKHRYAQGKKILILTWLKQGPDGSYKERVIRRLEEAGLPVDGIQLDVAHFFAERGKNRWRDWDVAVLWGMPIENPDALRMKCEALSQLVPEEQREALREQLHYQYSAGEGLQGLHRVGAIIQPKEWLLFASSGFLPLADYLKDIAAPGRFRKRDSRSNEAKDPADLDRIEELAQKIASLSFSNPRAIAGLMGLDPVARGALIQMGLLKPSEGPIGVVPQGFDQVRIRNGESPPGGIEHNRKAIETYSAKGLERCLGRREQQRIERRVGELTDWNERGPTKVTITDDDGAVRPYRILGDEGLGRQFLELCLQEEGKLQVPKPELTSESDESHWRMVLESCREAVEGMFARWRPDGSDGIVFEWTEESMLWAYWIVCQWQDEEPLSVDLPGCFGANSCEKHQRQDDTQEHATRLHAGQESKKAGDWSQEAALGRSEGDK